MNRRPLTAAALQLVSRVTQTRLPSGLPGKIFPYFYAHLSLIYSDLLNSVACVVAYRVSIPMCLAVEPSRSRVVLRVSTLALLLAAAGCSADSSRFSESPFGNPFRTAAGPGPQVAAAPAPAAPVTPVDAQPLPPSAGLPAPPAPGEMRGSSAGYPVQRPELTGSIHPKGSGQGTWTRDGGTPVTVGQGETLQTLSHRYGVPVPALMQANGINGATSIRPGQQIIIPRYSYAHAAPGPRVAGPVSKGGRIDGKGKTVGRVPPSDGIHVVAPGETVASLARIYSKPRQDIAKANGIPVDAKLRVGQRIKIPGAPPARVRTAAKAVEPKAKAAPAPKLAAVEPPKARVHTPAAEPITPEPQPPAAEPEPDSKGAAPVFRWPAHGRVLVGYGGKINGVKNDGINLSVPEGTSVKAAEDGVVAYAGSELKGYGNLVLVRHSNGFVTAYAHASTVLVKRGDRVKRGQIIAKSGQSGGVGSPQLHFEIRKGSTPVDPTQYLSGT